MDKFLNCLTAGSILNEADSLFQEAGQWLYNFGKVFDKGALIFKDIQCAMNL
jgi:hypothetical protein